MLSKPAKKFIKRKKVCITGSAGSIGSELARQITQLKPKQLLLLDQNETGLFDICQELPKAIPIIASVRARKTLDKVFRKYKPDIVFHAAAYKHLSLMEKYPAEAIATNVFGTLNMAWVSREYNVKKFILVSTDKAVEPTCIMGKSKAMAERICQEFGFVSVRFGNVLASQGSVIPIFWKQIKQNKPLTLTDPKMERYAMTIFEACELLIESACMGKGGETFVFDMGKPMKIIELARQMIRLSGKNLSIKLIGIRQGEKLKEKLINDNEELVGTKHTKIWKVKKK